MHKQRGYIRLEGLGFILVLAAIGFLAVAGGAIFALVWLWQHIQLI